MASSVMGMESCEPSFQDRTPSRAILPCRRSEPLPRERFSPLGVSRREPLTRPFTAPLDTEAIFHLGQVICPKRANQFSLIQKYPRLSSPDRKNILLLFFVTMCFSLRHPASTRGASPSSRNVGAGCGGRQGSQANDLFGGLAKSCGPGTPGLVLSARAVPVRDGD